MFCIRILAARRAESKPALDSGIAFVMMSFPDDAVAKTEYLETDRSEEAVRNVALQFPTHREMAAQYRDPIFRSCEYSPNGNGPDERKHADQNIGRYARSRRWGRRPVVPRYIRIALNQNLS